MDEKIQVKVKIVDNEVNLFEGNIKENSKDDYHDLGVEIVLAVFNFMIKINEHNV